MNGLIDFSMILKSIQRVFNLILPNNWNCEYKYQRVTWMHHSFTTPYHQVKNIDCRKISTKNHLNDIVLLNL